MSGSGAEHYTIIFQSFVSRINIFNWIRLIPFLTCWVEIQGWRNEATFCLLNSSPRSCYLLSNICLLMLITKLKHLFSLISFKTLYVFYFLHFLSWMANTRIDFPQLAYHNRLDSNLDCMTREPTTFPLSYIAQWNRRLTLWVIQPKALLRLTFYVSAMLSLLQHHTYLYILLWMANTRIDFPQLAYHNRRDSNLDCMIREPTTFPLSYRAPYMFVVNGKIMNCHESHLLWYATCEKSLPFLLYPSP